MERLSNLLADKTSDEEGSSLATQTPTLSKIDGGLQNDEAQVAWSKTIDSLKRKLDLQIFSAWVRPLEIERLSIPSSSDGAAVVTLRGPNKFCCDHVTKNYSELISTAMTSAIGVERVEVVVKVGSKPAQIAAKKATTENKTATSPKVAAKKERPARRVNSDTNLNPRYGFSNFVVGQCNQFTHAVALRICENLGTQYNPFFIYGGVGLGKTHLVNAIGNSVARRGKKVLLVSSEMFVSELISSLRTNRMHQFRSRFRSLDLLIIDDIQFLIGKERTQEEFFHTFNELHQRHKQIIITSDKVPQELVGLEERLRTRFASGISADLLLPDFETRVAILIKKAEDQNVQISPQVAGLISERIKTNVRELEGALNRLLAISSLHQKDISVSMAEEVLDNFIPNRKQEVTTEGVQRATAEKFNVSLSDILGKRRTQNIAFARQTAMYLCRELTGRSYPEIGALFGGRDHSTVIHAYRVVEGRIKDNPDTATAIADLRKKLTEVS